MTKRPIGETLLYVTIVVLVALALVMMSCDASIFFDSKAVYQAF